MVKQKEGHLMTKFGPDEQDRGVPVPDGMNSGPSAPARVFPDVSHGPGGRLVT